MNFISKNLNGSESPRCVDGRPDPKSPQGAQMLGGSLQPIVMSAIISGIDFNNQVVASGLDKLSQAGFTIGVHWGSHKHEDKSDCGFGDRLKDIIKTAQDDKNEILKRLGEIYETNAIDSTSLKTSYDFILKYGVEKFKIAGKDLIDLCIESKASSENLQGDHAEQVAFVNIKPNTTLDTQEVNKQGKQAFNLDLWAAIDQSKILSVGVDQNILKDLSLILYMATEMVLVEQKGKPALPVILNK